MNPMKTADGIRSAWVGLLALGVGVSVGVAQETLKPAAPGPVAGVEADPVNSAELGQTSLLDSFDWDKSVARIQEKGLDALKNTQISVQLRTMYLDRNKYDDSENETWAAGGSAGLKTGYLGDFLSLGGTAYTSQRLHGPDDKDGALLLKPDQEGYTVIGEAYGDIRVVDDVHAYVGRKAFDTPYINRNDVRMTPNTFEAAVLQGKADVGLGGSTLNYGAGYFSKIKERNSDEFVSMSEDAGADVDRGVSAAGLLFKKGEFSIGGIDYYSDDIINIAYTEAKYGLPVMVDWKLKLAAQYSDQQSVGDDLLTGDDFSADQAGVKADLVIGGATLTAAYTDAGGDANMQNPWSGCPGYTSVQVEDFNRDGEEALMLKANYACSQIKGLSAYVLWVNGTEPDDSTQYKRDEYDSNIQWAASEGLLKGLLLRVRYAVVQEDGGEDNDLADFRVTCSYDVPIW